MTENQTVGTDAQSGAEGTPNQPVSPPAQTPIQGDVTQLLAGLGEKIGSLESQLRGLQGRQDKTDNNFQAQLAKLNQYKQQGLTEPEALAEMEADDATEQRWKSFDQRLSQIAAALGSGGTAPGAQQMVAKALDSYKLDPKDPFVAAQMQGKSFANETEAELFAARVFRDKALSPNPNPAQASTSPGGFQAAANADELAAEMQVLSRNPTQNMARIVEIGKILKAGG
jgi:hypothetical protein